MKRVTRDIENPQTDRRCRNNWTAAPTIRAGTRLYTNPSWVRGGACEYRKINSYDRVAEWSALGKLLAEYTEDVPPENVTEALYEAGLDGWLADGVDHLVAAGVLTLAQVVAAAQAARDSDLG